MNVCSGEGLRNGDQTEPSVRNVQARSIAKEFRRWPVLWLSLAFIFVFQSGRAASNATSPLSLEAKQLQLSRGFSILMTRDPDALKWVQGGAVLNAASDNLAIVGAVSNTNGVSFSGRISGTTLFVIGSLSGSLKLAKGQILSGKDVREGTSIESQLTGVGGGVGTYLLGQPQSVETEVMSASYPFFPTGVSGIGFNKSAGNSVFGIYGEAHCEAAGVCTNEFDTFNEVADAPATYPYSRAIGTRQSVPVAISVVANHLNKPFHSAAGIEIGAFNPLDSFQFGIALSKFGAARYSLYQDATSSVGPINGIYEAIPGVGTNLILRTMGAQRDDGKVLDIQDSAGVSRAAIRQGGVLYVRSINVANQGGLNGEAPVASCGKISQYSSDNSFVVQITQNVKTCTLTFPNKLRQAPNCIANGYSPGPVPFLISQVLTGSVKDVLFASSSDMEAGGIIRAHCF